MSCIVARTTRRTAREANNNNNFGNKFMRLNADTWRVLCWYLPSSISLHLSMQPKNLQWRCSIKTTKVTDLVKISVAQNGFIVWWNTLSKADEAADLLRLCHNGEGAIVETVLSLRLCHRWCHPWRFETRVLHFLNLRKVLGGVHQVTKSKLGAFQRLHGAHESGNDRMAAPDHVHKGHPNQAVRAKKRNFDVFTPNN